MEMMSKENKRAMGVGPGFEVYEKWFTIVRVMGVILVCLLVLILSKLNLINFDPTPIIFGVGPAFLLFSLLIFFLRLKRPISQAQIYLELLADLIAISAGIHYAGGVKSPFSFIYLSVIATASTISLPVTLVACIFTIIFYFSLSYIEHSGVIPALQIYSSIGFDNSEMVSASVLMLLILILGFQASYYISKIKKEDEMMLKQEEDLRKFKEDFLFKTVHDLRAPGTAIRLAIEELTTENSWACSTDANHAEQTISIIQSLDQRMLDLVNDILKIGKSQNADIEIRKEPVDVHMVVGEATKNLRPIATSKKMKIEHEEKAIPKILADKEKVTEVFFNLIDNAIKYNKDGGTVSISHEVKNGMLEISIADQGVGIPTEDISKLFVPYFRSDTGKAVQGTGLGLYIVKNLIEKMGGNIRVSSKVGEGTTFTTSFDIASS
jgi:signal transduction histidine kinase